MTKGRGKVIIYAKMANTNIKIRELTRELPNEQLELIAENEGNIFNTYSWLKLFGEKLVLFAIESGSGEIMGGLALFRENRLGLAYYRNPPYTPYAGPFVRIRAQNYAEKLHEWKKILSALAEHLLRVNSSLISFTLNPGIIDTQPFIWSKFKVNPRYTYILDLTMDINEIQKNMSSERRNEIRNAIKDGLIVRRIDEPGIIKGLIKKTFARQNKALPHEKYLDKILFDFATPDNSFLFACFCDDKPTSGVFVVHDKHSAYLLLSGYDSETKHRGAGTYTLFEAIKYAQQLGLRYFDFEGSMVPNIEFFYRGFGGKLTPVFRISRATLILELFLKFFRREIF